MKSVFLKGLLHLIFPSLCAACRVNEPFQEELFCLVCEKKLPFIYSPEDALAALEGKEFFPEAVSFFYSLFYYTKDNAVADMIHRIKYNGQFRLARKLGALLGEKISSQSWDGFTIIPVPVHKKRRISRGFNQSEEIGKGLKNVLSLPLVNNYLIRTSSETSQTSKDKFQRSAVLNSSFEINKKIAVSERILLIDDVITTGSTINACVRALKAGGLKEVAVLSLGVSI